MRGLVIALASLTALLVAPAITAHLPKTAWFVSVLLALSVMAILLGHARWVSGDRSFDPRILLSRNAWLHPKALRKQNLGGE